MEPEKSNKPEELEKSEKPEKPKKVLVLSGSVPPKKDKKKIEEKPKHIGSGMGKKLFKTVLGFNLLN